MIHVDTFQAFFPKTRGKWKAHSSWEPPEKKALNDDDDVLESRWPAEVKIKKGYTWSEELGIAIKCLLEDCKTDLIEWIRQVRATQYSVSGVLYS